MSTRRTTRRLSDFAPIYLLLCYLSLLLLFVSLWDFFVVVWDCGGSVPPKGFVTVYSIARFQGSKNKDWLDYFPVAQLVESLLKVLKRIESENLVKWKEALGKQSASIKSRIAETHHAPTDQ